MKVVETIAKSLFNLFGLEALPGKPSSAYVQPRKARSHAAHTMHPWQWREPAPWAARLKDEAFCIQNISLFYEVQLVPVDSLLHLEGVRTGS